MPEPTPKGICALFLRGVTAEKYGFKTGEGVMDLVDHLFIKKEDIAKEIQTLGVMSDFEPAKKIIDACTLEDVLFVIDKAQKYGETFLMYYSEDSREEFLNVAKELEKAIEDQKREEEALEAAKIAAEIARQNIVYEDKPLTARQWVPSALVDTENEVKLMTNKPSREPIAYEVTRPKKYTKLSARFLDRNAESFEFRAYKDNNFKSIRESDIGIQVAPQMNNSNAQTTWYRPVNKAIQYEAPPLEVEPDEGEKKDELLAFLERVTVKVESALQQNEAVDIFHETFRMAGDDDGHEGAQADDELREIKNFADPTYSKSKVLAAIDWLPKIQGMVAVSAVKNISFDQRVSVSGQTSTSHILLWDFRQLVKPQLLMQSHHEVFTFRFNKSQLGLVAGGCITGQVVLWDISAPLSAVAKKQANHSSRKISQKLLEGEEEEAKMAPIMPKYVSNVDYSHKKCVADLIWLPPTTQINYRGQLVAPEYLTGHSYQFVTVAGDGLVMVWDTRFEEIAMDELKHIGRSKHVPQEKSSNKDGAQKPLWGPIFKAHLKRLEGVGELSLCKVCCSSSLAPAVSGESTLAGDIRSHLMVTTEEGDIIFADICARKGEAHGGKEDKEEEDDVDHSREYVRWIARDHSRPCVGLQQSPFFPDILLSIGDWGFHIWKVGEDRPLFVSPQSSSYLTGGAWSPTRPAVLLVACDTGHVMAWDFTESSFRPSVNLKATHSKLTSMEFLTGNNLSMKHQLLAAGDETGTLHIFEMPRNLVRPVHKEQTLMSSFLQREGERASYMKESIEGDPKFTPGSFQEPTFNSSNSDLNQETTETKTNETNAIIEEQNRIAKEKQKKEDDDFNKMEAHFIESLELQAKV